MVRQYSKGIFGYSGLQRVTRGYKGLQVVTRGYKWLKGVNLLSVTKYICLKKYYTCASYLPLVLLSQQSFGNLFIARNGRFTIMKENKPTSALNFHLISWFVWQQSPKRQFFWPKLITKNYTCSSSSFRQKIDLNNRRTTFAASLNAILWYLVLRFSLGVFAGHAFKAGIEYLKLARQCSKGILGNSLIP